MTSVALINRFPRQLARPFKDGIAYGFDDVSEYIKKYGSSYGIHISVYPFSTIEKGKVDYASAIIDKIFIDIDSPNWLEQIRILFEWAVYENDIISRYTMSGENAHSYLFCKETIQYKRSCIHNFQSYLEKELHLTIDPQVKGDLSRTFRIPNTFNFKRGRYAIILDEDLIFNHTAEEIHKIAEKYPVYKPKQIWYGNEILDLSAFDTEDFMYGISSLNTELNGELLSNEELKKLNIPYDKFPPCIISWLNNEDLGYRGRFALITYLRDQQITNIPLTYKEIVSILKNMLSNSTWLHVSTNLIVPGHNEGEGMRTIKMAYSNTKYKMYSCYQLRDFGLCPTHCGRWHPIYE